MIIAKIEDQETSQDETGMTDTIAGRDPSHHAELNLLEADQSQGRSVGRLWSLTLSLLSTSLDL